MFPFTKVTTLKHPLHHPPLIPLQGRHLPPQPRQPAIHRGEEGGDLLLLGEGGNNYRIRYSIFIVDLHVVLCANIDQRFEIPIYPVRVIEIIVYTRRGHLK